jgi:uncharacterized pyridoxal phosphate-containing UPF0001 family protein
MGMRREEEIAAGLVRVRARIDAACAAAGREPTSVTLVVITKTRPPDDIRILARLGVHDVGENRDQEAVPKVQELRDVPLTWHFVGQLQRNKAASVARYADFVHSVDRARLVTALDHGAERAGRRLKVFVQVDLDPSTSSGAGDGGSGAGDGGSGAGDGGSGAGAGGGIRGGSRPEDVGSVCAAVEAAQHVDLVGLMAVAPLGEDPVAAFDRLAVIRQQVLQDFPAATALSAGMSGDLEAAIAAGATHVRVGSAVLGERPSVR